MRGKVFPLTPIPCNSGITPAYAGKRYKLQLAQQPDQDHPRLCGEKTCRKIHLSNQPGSPPPMRGKDSRADNHRKNNRITPAYAGKSDDTHSVPLKYQDHPRLCGEKLPTVITKAIELGSPPPMRGKDNDDTTYSNGYRITPAYAGKRDNLHSIRSRPQDHPRLCGEKTVGSGTPRSPAGSPPPMRGKVPAAPVSAPAAGITPAYAGKSQR